MTGEEVTPQEMRVLVIGEGVWGKGDTLEEALKNAGRPKKYLVYVVHPDTQVNVMDGSLSFPLGMNPKEIVRKGIPK